MVGDTYSPDFPVKNSLKAYGGGDDAFVTVFNPAGSAILVSTYLGGSGNDRASSVRLDSAGDVYVAGSTTSANFPTLNALQPTFGGNTDVFITKLNPGVSSICLQHLLGRLRYRSGHVAGHRQFQQPLCRRLHCSTNFPTFNPAQAAIGGGDGDAFLAKLSSNGSSLIYSSYFGGSDDDRAMGVAVDALNNIYIVGTTASTTSPRSTGCNQPSAAVSTASLIKLSQATATQLGISAPSTTAGQHVQHHQYHRVRLLDSQGNPAGCSLHRAPSVSLAAIPQRFCRPATPSRRPTMAFTHSLAYSSKRPGRKALLQPTRSTAP